MTSLPSAETPPALSVVMPVCNGAAYLDAAIESVLAQTFGDFEFLIHDDGSTDGTPGILARHAAGDSRIRLSRDDNRGLTVSLNRLIGQARGRFIARMDADDICLPDRFARQHARLEAEPALVMLGTSTIRMDGEGRPIFVNRLPTRHEDIDRNNLAGRNAVEHPTVMMRRSAVERCGGYDARFDVAQDLDLWLRLAETGRIANMPEALLKYRLHGNSVSGSKRDHQMETVRRICEAAWERREIESDFEYQHWRMEDTRASRREFYLRYGWQAWRNGFRDTWRHYALQSLALAPLSPDTWKLLVGGALKRPPAQEDRTGG